MSHSHPAYALGWVVLGALIATVIIAALGFFYASGESEKPSSAPAAETPTPVLAPEITQPKAECGNGIREESEECDRGSSNQNSRCDAEYGSTCSYCDKRCIFHTVSGDYCGDGICDSDEETCSNCEDDCGECYRPPPYMPSVPASDEDSSETSFTSYTNVDPWYGAFCDKIDPYDLSVRKAAAKAIKNSPGEYSVDQLFDIYDWVKDNVVYQNVPLAGIPYTPSETLQTGSGDCKNQAVLIASMIEAIGGTAKVVADPSCTHAYTIVRFGDADQDLSEFNAAVAEHYGEDVRIHMISNADGIWVIFDPAGGNYPGDTLDECSGQRDVYFVDSCMSCAQQYPKSPYTFGDKCYSECPGGTVSANDYSCTACPEDYYSFNDKCVTCEKGYILGSDGKCHTECGKGTYCLAGSVCKNQQCYS